MAAKSKPDPPSREKWEKWFEILGNEVYALHAYRAYWRQFIKAAEDAGAAPAPIFDFFANNYIHRQAVAIRRLLGDDRREHGLRHLLNEVRDNPQLAKHSIDPDDVAEDLRSLKAGRLKLIHDFVDEYVAHRQRVPTAPVPTVADLHGAIDDLGVVLRKYALLVNDIEQIVEPILPLNLLGPFRKAWLPPLPSRSSLKS